ncbi:MAG TPA: hypothetical protein VEZ17_05400 [Chitinophagaceae bacterium]|jgi:hypothetical protein|nr:hypothetical protein [Chitinophagaceae bacterium]
MEDLYRPVSPEFYEELEELALAKKNCEVVFEKDGGRVIVQGRLEHVYEEDGAAFLSMDSGLHIRLDQLIKVDGKIPPDYC